MDANIKFKFVVLLSFIFLVSIDFIIALNVPLTIEDTTGINRIDEPVTTGVPISEDENILSIDELKITDNLNNNIPVQFSVLSRWGGIPTDTSKPIKWVLLDFNADVSSDSHSTYYLKDNGAGNAQNGMSIAEDVDKITINTGKAEFEISKNHFNLFDHVNIDTDNDGQIDDLIVDSPGVGGVVLTDRNGKTFYTNLEAPEEIIIEEQGPLRSVVKIRGVFKASDGSYFAPSLHNPQDYPDFDQPYQKSFVYYNARIHFYYDKDHVKIFLTLENNGANGRTNPEQNYAPIQIVYFDSVNLILNHNFSSNLNIDSSDSSCDLLSTDVFSIYQDWHENLVDSETDTLELSFQNGIYYETIRNSQTLSTGSINPGWMNLNDGSKGIGFSMRHFWQNFPKKLSVNSTGLMIALWPKEGYYPYCQSSDFPNTEHDIYCREGGRDSGVYLFDAGRHKTYEMAFRFYPGSNEDVAELSNSLEYPLMALASSEYNAETKALGMIAPFGLQSDVPELNLSLNRYEQLQMAIINEEISENAYTMLNLRTRSQTPYSYSKQNRFYSWMGFGDFLWDNQKPCAQHYDWTYVNLLQYIRTGEREFFDFGVEMAKHRYDIDQYHGERTDTSNKHKWVNHMAFYENSGHADPSIIPGTTADNLPSKVSKNSHTWNGGLVLYYLITGDRKAWESAEENAIAALNYYGTGGINDADSPGCAQYETRSETWPMLNLINLYRVNGNQEYFRVAKNIAKNRLLPREQQAGGRGNFGYYSCNVINGSIQPSVMWGYAIEPMIMIHYETQDPELAQLIVRMADFQKDFLIFGGDYDLDGNYRPIQSSYFWYEHDPENRGEPLRATFFGDLFAYAYILSGNSEYLDLARNSFKDTALYYNKRGNEYLDPKVYSIISVSDNMYTSTLTKVHGWLGRTNQVFLYNEWLMQQNGSIHSNCLSGADLVPYDDSVSIDELIAFIDGWKSGSITINKVLVAIGEWKSGC